MSSPARWARGPGRVQHLARALCFPFILFFLVGFLAAGIATLRYTATQSRAAPCCSHSSRTPSVGVGTSGESLSDSRHGASSLFQRASQRFRHGTASACVGRPPGKQRRATAVGGGHSATHAGTVPGVPGILQESGAEGEQAFLEFRSRRGGSVGPVVEAPDKEDAAVFQRALLAEVEAVPRPGSMPKVAFMFLTRGPLPMAPLWERFFSGHEGKFSIVIHTAPKYRYKTGELPKPFHGRHIRSKAVKWGDINVVDAERRLLAHAMLDPGNLRFVLLSESCIPLFNFTFVYNYLISSSLNFLRMKTEGKWARWNRDFAPLIPKDSWRKGGQWVALTRDAANLVIGDTEFYPEFRDHCNQTARGKPVCYADEHYMQTMLFMLLPGSLLESRSLTWAAWSPIAQHPMLHRGRDVGPALFEKFRSNPHCRWKVDGVKSVCYLFARKFHPDSVAKLLEIAPQLGM